MSIIPKISVGVPKKREKRNLSFDCSTTSNIGNIQPTMCREMIPNEKYSVKVSSLVRLASMPLPTFGRMSLRHHHVFVPIEDIYGAWNALLSGQHYKVGSSASYIPTKCPYFHMNSDVFIQLLLNYCDFSIAPFNNLNNPYTVTNNNIDWAGDEYTYGPDGDYESYAAAKAAAKAADIARIKAAWDILKTYGASNVVSYFGKKASLKLRDNSYTVTHSEAEDAGGVGCFGNFVFTGDNGTTDAQFADKFEFAQVYNAPVMPEGADFIMDITGAYSIMLRLKPLAKRLRTIFIGLGYQFSPYDPEDFNPFKLIAYYKAWFSLFRPDREKTWVDTNAYALIKAWDSSSGLNIDTQFTSLWRTFLLDLMKDCFYYLPMDYYSMAQKQVMEQPSETSFTIQSQNSVTNVSNPITATYDTANMFANAHLSTELGGGYPGKLALNPLMMKMAMRLYTMVNKNTVIGRNIREYLKVHYGVSDPNCDMDLDGVVRIGSSRVNITISDVMSTAENSEGFLGEYAGKGVGYNDSQKFSFEADKFGYWICLSVIVPESGYYQGYLRENRHLTRYDFFMDEWDAVGYQVLERGEVMDDYQGQGIGFNPAYDFVRSAAFGFVPRYSEYKVGRNIVNGDLSLRGLYNSMAPYTLDRRISGGEIKRIGHNNEVRDPDGNILMKEGDILVYQAPDFVPSVVYDDFRRIDPTDHLGQYNRIFNYTLNDLDHFIIHNVFDVSAFAPMKSLSTSFDTYGDEDEGSIDVTKA